ncbi:MAG: DUF885 family protein [Chloroflexota bacterium]
MSHFDPRFAYLHAVRARAEKQLGGKFNVRDFHDGILLGGAFPLDVLEMKVEEWINNMSF